MKKSLLFSAAVFAALGLASCSNDDMPAPVAGAETVISVKLPEQFGTRAGDVYFGSGSQATQLYVAIYEAGTANELFSNFPGSTNSDGLKVTPFVNLTSTVSVSLVKDKSYDFVFWAQDPSATSVYTFDSATKSISVNYTGMADYAENRDAFFSSRTGYTSGTEMGTVVLSRPMAQINIGTNDYAAYQRAGGQATSFGMKVTDVQNTLDLVTGAVSSSRDFNGEVTVAEGAVNPVLNGQAVSYPVTGYQYLAMGYFLVGDLNVQKTTMDVTLTVGGQDWKTYDNVPTQMNYRTNIYGALLTNPEKFTVEINPAFNTPDYNEGYAVWDGTSTTPQIDEATKTAVINSPEELAGLRELVNAGTDYSGYIFTLNTDVDLNNIEWTPIGSSTRLAGVPVGKSFSGTFDGNGKTVKNLKISQGAESALVGLFGSVKGGTVKNINFENLDVEATECENVGGVVGMLTGGGTVSNVNVKSGTLKGKQALGGVVGRVAYSGTVTGCSNGSTVVSSGSNAGGVIGIAYYTNDSGTMTVTDCTNSGAVSGTTAVGGVLGFSAADVNGCTNTGTIHGNGTSVGGICGEQQNAGSVTGCTNRGDITNAQTAYGNGGIVGWIRYTGAPSAYARKSVISVTQNTNYGNVSGGNDAGGIVGTCYSFGEINNNKNYATSLSAVTFAAGIVGNVQFDNGQPDGMTGDMHVYVENNVSTTPIADIKASLTNQYVYVNDASRTTVSGNTDN